MYGLIGKLKTHPGQRETLAAAMLDALKHLRELDGCYSYIITNATDDPDTLWVTEVWRSVEDHHASLTNEGIKAIIAAALPLLAEAPGGFEVEPLGGVGLSQP